LGAFLSKTAPDNSPIPLNSLFPEDSTDSEDLDDESGELSRFMV
jgi:hypothetical protein